MMFQETALTLTAAACVPAAVLALDMAIQMKIRTFRELFWEPLYEGSERNIAALKWETAYLKSQHESENSLTENRVNYLLEYSKTKLDEAIETKDRMENRLTETLKFSGGLITVVFTGIKLRYLGASDGDADFSTWAILGLSSFVVAVIISSMAMRAMKVTSTMPINRTMDRAADWAQSQRDLELLVATTTHNSVESVRYVTEWAHRRQLWTLVFMVVGLGCLVFDIASQ